MAVLKRRTRMVNFRLSEDEYENLRNLCLAAGARSISDFAREAVCRCIIPRASASSEPADGGLRRLSGKIEELDRAVVELSKIMGVDLRLLLRGNPGGHERS